MNRPVSSFTFALLLALILSCLPVVAAAGSGPTAGLGIVFKGGVMSEVDYVLTPSSGESFRLATSDYAQIIQALDAEDPSGLSLTAYRLISDLRVSIMELEREDDLAVMAVVVRAVGRL